MDTLSSQNWSPVAVEEVDWAFLYAEADRASLSRKSPILATPNFTDLEECVHRRELLFKIRAPLLNKIPQSTQWYRVKFLTETHLDELLVIGRCGWDSHTDSNELALVAKRTPQKLIANPDSWYPLILWGHSQSGPFTILEGNHRLIAYACQKASTHLSSAIFIGISEQPCVFHLPDTF